MAEEKTSKKPWESKTLWVSAITAIAPLVAPPLNVWIAANPDLFASALGLMFMGLRMITKGEVSIK